VPHLVIFLRLCIHKKIWLPDKSSFLMVENGQVLYAVLKGI
jgi:hypothetical protein